MVAGRVGDRLGRRRGLMMSSVIGTLAGVIMTIAQPSSSWELLVLGRLISGVSSGLYTVLVPIYVSEIAPVHMRGGIGAVNGVAANVGVFIPQVLGLSELLGNERGWSWILVIITVPCILQLITLAWSPESPRYLGITRDNSEEARKALMKLRNNDVETVETELREMKEVDTRQYDTAVIP